MPESAGRHVDTHVHLHQSDLTAEELEASRQADEAKEEERNRRKNEEETTPAPISENPRRPASTERGTMRHEEAENKTPGTRTEETRNKAIVGFIVLLLVCIFILFVMRCLTVF
jgi:hypothetical protein